MSYCLSNHFIIYKRITPLNCMPFSEIDRKLAFQYYRFSHSFMLTYLHYNAILYESTQMYQHELRAKSVFKEDEGFLLPSFKKDDKYDHSRET